MERFKMNKLQKQQLKENLARTDEDIELKHHIALREYYKTQYEYHSQKVEQLNNK